ncbi:transposase family protein [Streptomyces melanogenes]|uniref:transposase family protein n=1 Tax=Streptomyces melanogenes TaxID=67326 RepID=UPI0037B7BE58
MGDHATELLKVFFSHLSRVVVTGAVRIGTFVRISDICSAPAARCPGCGTVSARVHSRYGCRLADTAVDGQETAIDLAVRRFFCDHAGCANETFAEEVDDLTFRYGRRTVTLQHLLQQVALALGGQAGQHLAERLAARVSGPPLLRLIRPMDLFADWLRQHPHVDTIYRDRGGAFAVGAQRGQPGISQVADRRHPPQPRQGAGQDLSRHRSCLKAPQPDTDQPAALMKASGEETTYGRKIRERLRDVQELFQRGLTIGAISARLGLDRKTVRCYARAITAESLMRERPGRSSALTPHRPYLVRRWAEGATTCRLCAMRSQPAARSYQGCRKSVRRFLKTLARHNGPRAVPPPPSAVADVVRWIIGRPENQSNQARQDLTDFCGRRPEIAEACCLARGFATILRRRDGHRLGDRFTQADESPVKEIRRRILLAR